LRSAGRRPIAPAMSAATAGMQRNDITAELLSRLARLRAPADARVLSLYIDLDPSEKLALPPARRTAINALIDQARRAEDDLPSHRARAWLREEVERVRDLLVRGMVDGRLAEGARGLAVLACAPAELLEVVRLARPVRASVAVAPQPVIQPLAEIGPPRRWVALVTDGDDARLFEGHGEELVEIESFRDQHRRRHRRGAWAPGRQDGPLGVDERRHVRRAIEELVKLDRERGYELVVVGASEPVWAEIRRATPPGLLARLAGRFNADVEEASPGEIRSRSEPLLEAADAERERRRLELLDQQGAKGLKDTLELVFQRRVHRRVGGQADARPRRDGLLPVSQRRAARPA
jgi:hypothetical protein